VGFPTVFIRLTGCPLRCHYCDTTYAFSGGEYRSVEDIVAEVAPYQAAYVTVTGGEPLAQRDCQPLLAALCDAGYAVSLETSGALDIAGIDPRVVIVMDLKTPKSGEMARNLWQNIEYLRSRDQVKFVICARQDYDWAKMTMDQYGLAQRCEILFSPSFADIDATELAEWVLADRLPVRLQVQLHKILWGEKPGH